jgi:hypothetical protein
MARMLISACGPYLRVALNDVDVVQMVLREPGCAATGPVSESVGAGDRENGQGAAV